MILPLFGWGGGQSWKVILVVVLSLSILSAVYVKQGRSPLASLGCAIDNRLGFREE